jgi:hypothetical protein
MKGKKTLKHKIIKSAMGAVLLLLCIFTLSSCDPTILDIYTQINSNYSGTRSLDLAIKTDYLKKGEIIVTGKQTLYDRIIASLPEGKIETFEKDDYTHFKSTVEFNDINFLQHVSIDKYSDEPPGRFYAKMTMEDFFFYSNYFFEDYVDMKIDDSIIAAQGEKSDLARVSGLFGADSELLKITYQIKFPVNIIKSNADKVENNNIAIWNLKFGDQKEINIEGKRIKYLTYVLLVVLGLIGAFIIFLVFVLAFSRRRKRITRDRKPFKSYDNYFKQDKYFTSPEDRDDI